MKKTLNLIQNKETKTALQELINLGRLRNSPTTGGANVLPMTFRGIVPSTGKEIIFTIKAFGEYYITVPGECENQPIPIAEGQELFGAILDHWKPRVGWSNMVWIKEEKDEQIKSTICERLVVQ
jgi:hypothetical protein